MKTIFYTLFCTCFALGTAVAQATFTYTPDSVMVSSTPEQTDVEGHANVHNLEALVKTIKWERTEIMLTSGCETQVCDANLCYLPAVSSKKFDLGPNETVDMIVHMDNQTGNPCCAVVKLKLSNFNNPADSASAFYIFNNCSALLGSGEPLPLANVRVFPNPITTYFMLENADEVSAIHIYTLDGREVLNQQASADQVYDFSRQIGGTYVLVLEDKNGRNFQAMELHKN